MLWRLEKYKRQLGLWAAVLLAGMLLALISACTGRDREQILVHPAVSLVKSDRKLAFFEPAWSPDGNLLAATGLTRCPLGNCIFGVYILNPETGSLHPVVEPGAEGQPAWTHDPEVVSFAAGSGVYTATVDGEGPRFFSDGFLPSWSPNGRYVALARVKAPKQRIVVISDLATGREYQVVETEEAMDSDITALSWSPDSSRLAISAFWATAEAGHTSAVYVVRADGTDLEQVAEGVTQLGWVPDVEWFLFMDEGKLRFAPFDFGCVITPLDITGIEDPVISPSGDQIAFVHNGNIYLLSLDRLLGANREKLVCPNR